MGQEEPMRKVRRVTTTTHRSPRTPGPSPRSVIRLDASGLYHFPPKEPKQPSAPLRHHRRLSRANSGSQNSLISIDEENALTEAAVEKALLTRTVNGTGHTGTGHSAGRCKGSPARAAARDRPISLGSLRAVA